jgi:protein-S-isoprenylcysteine O-methyltransferase Ste14
MATQEESPERVRSEKLTMSEESRMLNTSNKQGLPLLIALLSNLVVAVVLARVLEPVVSLPCVPAQAIAWSLTIFLLLFSHLVWHYLGPMIESEVEGTNKAPMFFEAPIELITLLLNALHPQELFVDRYSWVWGTVLFWAPVIIGLILYFLVPLPPEETPIVQRFSVQYRERDGTPPKSFRPSDVVEIMLGEQILVEAEILKQADALCKWSAAKGTLQSTEGCSTLYSAPFDGTGDILDILAQSPCKTWDAHASLHIKVVPNNP